MLLPITALIWIQHKAGNRYLIIGLLVSFLLVLFQVAIFRKSSKVSFGNLRVVSDGYYKEDIYSRHLTDYTALINDTFERTNAPIFIEATLPTNKTTSTSQKTRLFPTKMDQPAAWKLFAADFRMKETYNPASTYLDKLLHDLSYGEIVKASLFQKGTQLKLLLQYSDGNFAIGKPMRVERNFYSAYDKPESFLLDLERHTAEIAAFHLDRILDFRRVPPCIGRKVNLTEEIIQKTNDSAILDTIRTKDGNTCFIGKCRSRFCSEDALTCAKGDLLELSVCQKLPNSTNIREQRYYWCQIRRTIWEDSNICTGMLKDPKFTEDGVYLDVMEIAVFDYLILNYDRHHYEVLSNKEDEGKLIALLDNGKGFGNPHKDDVRLLAPLSQCCRFRNTTYQRMVQLTKKGNKLGDKLRASFYHDPMFPILTEEYFAALDQKLTRAILEINKCVEQYGLDTVFSER